MRIGVLGTGMVGQAIGTKLVQLGHEVRMGSRSAGSEKAVAWAAEAGPPASEGTFSGAAGFGEVVFSCLSGAAAVDVLSGAAGELEGKLLIDVTNPLEFPADGPPTSSSASTTAWASASSSPARGAGGQGPQHDHLRRDGRPGTAAR